MSKNPYASKESKKQLSQKALKEREQEVIELANKCLKSVDFTRYNEAYNEIKVHLLNAILYCPETDPIKFAFTVKSHIDRYKDLDMLCKDVNEDAKKVAQ